MKEYIKPEITIEVICSTEDILSSSTIFIVEDDDEWLDKDKFGE